MICEYCKREIEEGYKRFNSLSMGGQVGHNTADLSALQNLAMSNALHDRSRSLTPILNAVEYRQLPQPKASGFWDRLSKWIRYYL